MDAPEDRPLRFDDYEVDVLRRELRRGGAPLPLTSRAFDVLCELIRRREEVVSKDDLFAAVWSGRIVEENNLSQAIAAIRRALGTNASDHRFILTVPGRGYRFVAELHPGTPRGLPGEGEDEDSGVAAAHALLRAQYRLHQRDLSAPRAFLDAIRLDPASARAYAGLAMSYLFLAHNDVAPGEVFPLARAAALQAIRIDPASAEARIAHGRVLQLVEWNWPEAEAELRRAIAIDPGLTEAHSALAHVLATTGRFEEALAEAVRARTLDPLSPIVNVMEAGFQCAAGRFEAAHAGLRRTFALEPDFWIALVLRAGMALEESDAATAVVDLELAATRARPSYGSLVLATLALACTANGEAWRSVGLLQELRDRQRDGYVPAVNLAAVHLALGEADAALDELERAHALRDIRMVFLGIDARWNPLRATPRFQALAQAMGLPNGRGYSRL
ncbi:MAG TPA: winged helix-turn-helix domain-containing protein [Lysobacter sp.]|nr:winged helix-turn-helix domain-containing protein [Lysobacter sp.]